MARAVYWSSVHSNCIAWDLEIKAQRVMAANAFTLQHNLLDHSSMETSSPLPYFHVENNHVNTICHGRSFSLTAPRLVHLHSSRSLLRSSLPSPRALHQALHSSKLILSVATTAESPVHHGPFPGIPPSSNHLPFHLSTQLHSQPTLSLDCGCWYPNQSNVDEDRSRTK